MGLRRILVVAGAVVVAALTAGPVSLLVAAPAHALRSGAGPAAALGPVAASSMEDDAGDAIVALQSEVLALVALNVWRDPPQSLLDVHDDYASYVEGLGRADLVRWVLSADTQGARVLTRMEKAGAAPTPAERAALGALDAGAKAALRGGGRFPVPAQDYARALEELDARAAGLAPAADPAPAGGSAPAGPASALPSPGPSTAQSSSGPTSGPSSSGPTDVSAPAEGSFPSAVVAAVVGALLLGAAAAVVLVRRRVRRPAGLSSRQVVGLLDAGRRLAAAQDVDDAARTAVTELAGLLRVDGAALVATGHGADGGWRVLADPQGLLGALPPGGALARTAETGQAGTAQDDPWLEDRAVLCVPVTVSGRVVAVLAAVRASSRPFGLEDLRVAAELAPLVATALQGAAALEDVRTQASRDALTGLPNRRALDVDLHAEVEARAGRTTAVVMVDVDHFKSFNDREGHAAGDAALRAVAQALAATLRPQDGAYRYGGEEFCLLLRHVTEQEVRTLLDEVLERVRAVDVPGAAAQPAGRLSVSAGVALLGSEEATVAVLRADEALYRAKEGGRDCYLVAPPLSGPTGSEPDRTEELRPDAERPGPRAV